MYLNIDLKDVKKEQVREVLKNIGVTFEEFNTSLEMFLKEEAEFRLENLLGDSYFDNSDFLTEEDVELLSEKYEKAMVKDIASEYFDSEIFDYDMLDDIRDKVVKEYLDKTFETDLYISKEELREINVKLSIDDMSELETQYIEDVKIDADYREIVGVADFDRTDCKLELVLCSSQTNYWLEANLIIDGTYYQTTELFFELEENEVIEMEGKNNLTFSVNIKVK